MYKKFIAGVGRQCRKARRMRDISITQACHDLGWCYDSIQGFETGKSGMSAKRIEEYLKYLNIHLQITSVVMTKPPEHMQNRYENPTNRTHKIIRWNPEEADND